MRRRAFIAAIGGAAALPFAARAQQAMPVIGFLDPTTPAGGADRVQALQQGLGEAGYVEGRNVAIEYRWADDKHDRLPTLAADLVRRQPAVIITGGGSATAVAAKSATSIIPIVFLIGGDPVKLGLVSSLNRPGGNITGVTLITVETVQKRLEMLQELVPKAKSFALLIHSNNPNVEAYSRDVQSASRVLGRRIDLYKVAHENEIETVFATLAQRHTGGVIVTADPIFTSRYRTLVGMATRLGIPTMYPYREFAWSGGLISYGPNLTNTVRQVGNYAGRILKGEKPADLPVQQVTKIELVINLKTAKALGLNMPMTLLGRADEVIE